MSSLVYRLMERHQQLDEQLRSAQSRRFADPFEIRRLKTLKLMLKDRIRRLTRQRSPA
jgi:hypothetical protein